MAEKNPWQKWSIWYLWEQFLVLEHRDPDFCHSQIRDWVEDTTEDMEIVNISLYVCINTNIVNNKHKSDSLDKLMQPPKIA